MELPTKLEHTLHAHGGRVVSIEKMSHSTDPPEDGFSRDTWFFLGDVEWDDGGKSEELEMHPGVLCFDGEHHEEVLELSEMISKYLVDHGTWDHESVDHKPRGWNANR